MTSETRGEKEPTSTPVSNKSSTRTGTSLGEYVSTSSSTGCPPRERRRGLEVAHGESTDYVTRENLVYKFSTLSINESTGEDDGTELETESPRLEQGERETSPPASGLQPRGAEANVPPVLTDIEGLDQESLERGVSTFPPTSLPRHRVPSGVETTRASRPSGVNASEAGEPSNLAPIRQHAGSVVARPLLLTLRELAMEARLKMKRRVAEQFGGGEPECPALKTSKF
ncbi:hypothetical protein HPB52_025318 [Rhipicephalus sanguineus]|uniref:Uncharacterized protein n=1 Tax=Rhipicephalus sanguineus TaxID=34632 RepID=A0A9D4P8Z6_RHISA|nr:hypothetical protein HPB52_025318 [Rhipicephalus sanguineus]